MRGVGIGPFNLAFFAVMMSGSLNSINTIHFLLLP